MGRGMATALVCLALLAACPAAAGGKPQLSDAGLYEVSYQIDKGNLVLQQVRLLQATQEVAARDGVAFGVRCRQVQGQPLQAGYLHPGEVKESRFWGVEGAFDREGGAEHFYGFVFEPGSRPVPGAYAVNLYRADDGSLVARQLFQVVAEQPAAPAGSPRKEGKR